MRRSRGPSGVESVAAATNEEHSRGSFGQAAKLLLPEAQAATPATPRNTRADAKAGRVSGPRDPSFANLETTAPPVVT
jgi:hypothetical protein